jgi:hypothetical protein
VIAVKFLEGTVQLFARLRIVVPGSTFHLNIAEHMLVCVCFREVPFLLQVFLPVFLYDVR